jgi:hypothetical protein
MRRAFRAFPGTPGAVTDARRFVRDLLAECAEDEPSYETASQPAALLATELVAEALAHRADAVHVSAECLDDRVRVEVYDTNRMSHVAVGEDAETRRIRLQILNTLADRWSMQHLGSGQLNWFELRVAGN